MARPIGDNCQTRTPRTTATRLPSQHRSLGIKNADGLKFACKNKFYCYRRHEPGAATSAATAAAAAAAAVDEHHRVPPAARSVFQSKNRAGSWRLGLWAPPGQTQTPARPRQTNGRANGARCHFALSVSPLS